MDQGTDFDAEFVDDDMARLASEKVGSADEFLVCFFIVALKCGEDPVGRQVVPFQQIGLYFRGERLADADVSRQQQTAQVAVKPDRCDIACDFVG